MISEGFLGVKSFTAPLANLGLLSCTDIAMYILKARIGTLVFVFFLGFLLWLSPEGGNSKIIINFIHSFFLSSYLRIMI